MTDVLFEAESKIAVARGIGSIVVGNRLRRLDEAKVTAFMDSIRKDGLRTPITVFGGQDAETARLSAGGHRLEACRRLGMATILCFHEQGDDFDCELWEIDENLIRSDLTPADRALFTHRRKEIYQIKFPDTVNGTNQHSRVRKVCEPSGPKRFTAATAEATGQKERTIQLDAERGSKISEAALRMLRGTRHDKGVTLDQIKRLATPEAQEQFARDLLASDRNIQAESKVIRTANLRVSRATRLGLVQAIAERGKVTAGEMPRAAFPILYADPPWEQEAWSDETGQDKGLLYPPMPLDEIKALCAGDKSPATASAQLFLWVTANRLHHGIEVLQAWGFEYVTCMVWDKVDIGMGRHVRDRHEILLIGKRGTISIAPLMGENPPSLYSERKTGHSRKPVWFAEQIERQWPGVSKLELFNRRESLVDGDVRLNGNWSFWGFEAAEEPKPEEAAPADFDADDRELYRNAISILHEGGAFDVAVLQERLGIGWAKAVDLYDRIELAEHLAPARAPVDGDPVVDAVVSAGFVPNTYILELNRGLTNSGEIDLPSRLFRYPIEFMDRKRSKAPESRLLLRHPLLREAPAVAAFIDDVETKTGLHVEWEPHDEFGRDIGRQWRWYHAVDLCCDKHWQGLLETRRFTDDEAIYGAVRLELQHKKRLSIKNARAIMGALGSVEPEGRSAKALAGNGLWPFRDGDKKYIAPNIRPIGEVGAWLVIHGIEDGWLAYVGDHLSVTAEGMARRATDVSPDAQADLPLDMAEGGTP